MRIIEVDDPVTLAALLRQDPTRSTGLHLSTIIKDICVKLEPERFGGPMRPEFVGVGLAFEDVLAPAIRRLVGPNGYRPGEFRRDGIAMSPDWIGDELEEWKAAWVKGLEGWKALENPKLLRYHLQAKSYCAALGTDRMRFRVLFVNGDYYPPAPTLRTFMAIYTRQELRDNWSLIQQHARDMGVL